MLTILNNSAVISFCRNLISQSWANDSALMITRSVCVSIYVLICPVFCRDFNLRTTNGPNDGTKGDSVDCNNFAKGEQRYLRKEKTSLFL